jgi:hypothetical protein
VENGVPRTESQRVAAGCIIAALVGLNLWYDYYHPLGLIFDAFIVIALIIHWIRKA